MTTATKKKIDNKVNREAMLAVADVIEYADRFDIRSWARRPNEGLDYRNDAPKIVWESCDTTACIAGWTVARAYDVAPRNRWGEIDYFVLAQKELGLTRSQADRLFYYGNGSVWSAQAARYGWVPSQWGGILNAESITATQAAQVLRDIANNKIKL